MLTILTLLLFVYLTDKAITIGYKYYVQTNNFIKQRQLNKKLIANHPEMKGVSIDNGDLLFFSSDREFKSIIMSNEEEGENIAIEEDERFSIAVNDAYDDDEYLEE